MNYESPMILQMPLQPENVEMKGRCRGRSQICGHGEDGCMTANVSIEDLDMDNVLPRATQSTSQS